MAATMQGGANAKRSQYLTNGYGHKGSDLVWIVQAKCRISKEKE